MSFQCSACLGRNSNFVWTTLALDNAEFESCHERFREMVERLLDIVFNGG